MTTADLKGVQVRLTAAFIQSLPVTVQLTPYPAVPDSSGGRVRSAGEPRPPIVVALAEPGRTGFDPPITTGQGSTESLDYDMIAMPGTTILPQDRFVYQGYVFVVENVIANDWEVRASVKREGPVATV